MCDGRRVQEPFCHYHYVMPVTWGSFIYFVNCHFNMCLCLYTSYLNIFMAARSFVTITKTLPMFNLVRCSLQMLFYFWLFGQTRINCLPLRSNVMQLTCKYSSKCWLFEMIIYEICVIFIQILNVI